MNSRASSLNQSGLVSIVVTVVLMMVISLVVLSFATLSRREQRQTLDRQLATQATYAAESGINDAVKALSLPAVQSGLTNGSYDDNCTAFMTDAGLNGDLDGTNGVSYTCVQVNTAPSDISYSNVDTNSKVVSLQLASGNIDGLNIYWDGANSSKDCARASNDSGNFPASDDWNCDMGLLRVDLISLNADGSIPGEGRTHLNDNAATFVLSPVSGGGGNSSGYNDGLGFLRQGKIIPGNCSSGNVPRACRATITGMGQGRYFMRIKSLYRNSDVTIASTNDGTFRSAQAVIDVTGRAQDVLKRLQVRVPLTSALGSVPEFGVQSATTICKKLDFSAAIPSSVDSDPACQIGGTTPPPGGGGGGTITWKEQRCINGSGNSMFNESLVCTDTNIKSAFRMTPSFDPGLTSTSSSQWHYTGSVKIAGSKGLSSDTGYYRRFANSTTNAQCGWSSGGVNPRQMCTGTFSIDIPSDIPNGTYDFYCMFGTQDSLSSFTEDDNTRCGKFTVP